MNDAVFGFAAVPFLLFALFALAEGAIGVVHLGLRMRAQAFTSGLVVVCKKDWIDVSNPTDREGWVRVANVDGNGGVVVLDLDGGDHFDPARRAYADPSTPFLLAPRTTKHVTLARSSNAVECDPKPPGGHLFATYSLIDSALIREGHCDTWQVTLISALSEEAARDYGDGGVTVDCPIAP